MSRLPQIGDVLVLFGVGCEGCGHFHGEFEVLSVMDGNELALVVEARDIHCEGGVDQGSFAYLRVLWNPDLECWQTDCAGHPVVVNIAGHYRGPHRAAA